VCLSLREVTSLWRFNGRSDGNFEVMDLQRRQSEGVMNNFATEAASVIKESRAERPSFTEETVERVRESYVRSPRKTVSRASRELQVPESAETVKRVRESFVRSPRKSVSRASRELQVPESF
jgi:hypothetical protein